MVGGASPSPPADHARAFDPRTIERPDPALWTYYVIVSLLSLFLAPLLLCILYFRYHTLRYRFDDEGISMSVGYLFRREVHLTYRRIQDIHVTRGIIQRRLGLATISIQTASGSATAEMQIEGLRDPDALRDWLYARMRGATVVPVSTSASTSTSPSAEGQPMAGGGGMVREGAAVTVGERADTAVVADAAVVLEEILDEVRMLRARMERRP